MIRDITFGQYFPGSSAVHRMDPRMKLILTLAFIVMLFLIQNPMGFLIAMAYVLIVILVSRIPFRMVLKSVKPIIPLVVFTSILNIFFVDGDVLLQLGFLKITLQGVSVAVKMVIRIVCLIMGTSLLTYTTSPIALTDAIERLLHPLNKIRFPVHEMAMIMSIALRFIPTLIEETDKIMSAQKARGADMESGSLLKRARALIPILIPLFVSAFRRAEELALAMECRCYRGGEGRTRMRQLHYGRLDFYAAGFTALALAGIILINLFAPVLL